MQRDSPTPDPAEVAGNLTPIEFRVLAYLDQHGPTHRTTVVCDLASEKSRIALMGRRHNGSNGATPLIMGKWCSRLTKADLVRNVRTYAKGYYQHHAITEAGRRALRAHLQSKDTPNAR